MFQNKSGVNYCDMSSSNICSFPVTYSQCNSGVASQYEQEFNISTMPSTFWLRSHQKEPYVTNFGESNSSNCIVKFNEGQDIIFLADEFHSFVPEQRSATEHSYYQDFTLNYKPNRNPLKYRNAKRRRTTFTTEQIIALEEVFKKKPYVHREERVEMMRRLHISERSIKVWFQNRRRLTEKRNNDYSTHSPLSEDSSDSIVDKLTFIESYINENTDEKGYVTLDSEVMKSLVEVIDECLSQDVKIIEETIPTPVPGEAKAIYEPISPVSLSDSSEDLDYHRSELESGDTLLGITDYYYL